MATIKEKGTIAVIGELQSGTSQSGNPWYRQTIVVDVPGYNGSYRKIALQASGNICGDIERLKVGDKVEVSYQVTGREYNGRWYNNVDLYRIEVEAQPQAQAPQAPAFQGVPAQPQAPVAPAYPPQVQPAYQPQAPAYPQRRVQSQPQFPANMPTDLQDGDLPAAIFQ